MRTTTLFAVFVVAVLTGCTSMQAAKVPTEELRREIRAGGLVVPGEKIEVTGSDGVKQSMTVYRVDDDALRGLTKDGEQVEVPIDDVAVLAKEKFSPVRSTAFASAGAPFIFGGMFFTLAFLGIGF